MGQVEERTVDADQAVATPAFDVKSAARGVHRLQDRLVVQFDEGGVTQFEPCLTPSRSGNGRQMLTQAIEKLVEVQWHRPEGLLH
jgi:hypothetical protein